jgi:hypothetical protein
MTPKKDDIVYHGKFGRGIVEESCEVSSRVYFPSYGKKTILNNYLSLEEPNIKLGSEDPGIRNSYPIIITGFEKDRETLKRKIKEVKSTLNEDIYTVSLLHGRLRQFGFSETDIKKHRILEKIGYYRVGKKIYLHCKHTSPKEFILYLMKGHNLFRPDEYLCEPPLNSFLLELVEDNTIIEVSDGSYLTPERISSLNLYKEIELFKQRIIALIDKKEYLTIDYFNRENEESDYPFISYGFSDWAIERLIRTFPNIGLITISNKAVFYLIKQRKKTRVDLFLHFFNGKESIYASDIADKISDELGVAYNEQMAACDANDAGLYFNRIIGKIYKCKDTFLKEVYHDAL